MFAVDPDIRRARTPSAELYTSGDVFRLQLERVFKPSWQSVPALGAEPGSCQPFTLLPETTDVPLVLARDPQGVARCLSNVCTHRANLIVDAPRRGDGLRCRYHGRRFSLSGRCLSMPEFEAVADFPANDDHLPELALGWLGPLGFTSLDPCSSFESWCAHLRESLSFAPWHELSFAGQKDYLVNANWALYVENYLEGFHIPYVHPALNKAIDWEAYTTELFDTGSVQKAPARSAEPAFDLPAGRLGGLYFWLFPSTMLNVYPWGISLNAVVPLAIDRTRVHFESWVWDAALRGRGAGADLDKVELEDEAVVENVQRGVRSPLYGRGRYSPSQEAGVHHFHRLLAAALGG